MKSIAQSCRVPAVVPRDPQRSRIPCARLRSEAGQDTVEYALLASWISIAAILAIQAIAPYLRGLWLAVKFALMAVRTSLPFG